MAKRKLPDDLLERLVPVLLVASIGLAFAVGVLWQKVNTLEGSGSADAAAAGQQLGAGAQQEPVDQGPSEGKLSDDQAKKLPSVDDSDHVRGNRDANVYLITYSDYQCPYCSRFHPTLQQLMDEYGDDIAVVYRHFPLDAIHPQARPAAEASECVADLGGEDAFWKFTDAIFEDQTRLSDLASVASEVGINRGAFTACTENRKFEDVVEEDYQKGMTAGVTGTPGNFIVNKNGEVWFVPGAYPYERIQPMVDEALGS
jgi:protein-disulfide isomerase